MTEEEFQTNKDVVAELALRGPVTVASVLERSHLTMYEVLLAMRALLQDEYLVVASPGCYVVAPHV